MLNKNVETKKKNCETIRGILAEYDPNSSGFKPGKMFKASVQVAIRLIRDKMWAVFTQGISMANSLFNHFIFNHPVPKQIYGEGSIKVYKELLTRCCDANERVQEKAEDTLEAMILNEKITNAEVLHETLLKPLQVSFD